MPTFFPLRSFIKLLYIWIVHILVQFLDNNGYNLAAPNGGHYTSGGFQHEVMRSDGFQPVGLRSEGLKPGGLRSDGLKTAAYSQDQYLVHNGDQYAVPTKLRSLHSNQGRLRF